jgi:hypothetical protein
MDGWTIMLKMSDVLAVAAEQAKALENASVPLDQLNFTLVVAGQELSIRWRQVDPHPVAKAA